MELIDREINCTLKLNNKEIERILDWYLIVRGEYENSRIGLEPEDIELCNRLIELTGVSFTEEFI